MQFVLNGEPRELKAGTTIQDLVNDIAVGTNRYAVERNEEILPRSRHADTIVNDNDRIEVVVAIGGG